jgi:hypothetical protein
MDFLSYCLESNYGGKLGLYKNDVIIFLPFFDNDSDYHNSLNLSKIYFEFLEKKDKTTFTGHYMTVDSSQICFIDVKDNNELIDIIMESKKESY